MQLPNELITEFVKATKDETKPSDDSVLYGTATVEAGGLVYVKIDGSEELTPVTKAATVNDGERVMVTIKDHTATVVGNLSSPAARSGDVEDLGAQIGEFNLVIADKVSTSQLNAQVARINELVADNVTIKEKLVANDASIENLEANKIDADTVKATYATIENLNATNASIETLDVEKIDAETVVSTYATIENLDATNATIENLGTKYATIENLNATNASIDELEAKKIDADEVYTKYATIENLNAAKASIEQLDADKIDANEVVGKYATIENLNATNANIDELEANKIDADTVKATYATIANLNAANAKISNLTADVADIDTLIFGSASGDTIQTSFANAVIAQLGNAQIKSAMVDSISAGKITAGDINTNSVRVLSEDGRLVISDETIQISDSNRVRVQIGKDASNDYSINVWDTSGDLMFSKGGITDSAIKEAIIRNDMVSETANISASKLDIDSLFEEINGSEKTIKSTKIYLDDKKQTLDVAFTSVTSDVSDTKNLVSSQGTAISTIQGQISSKIWEQDIKNATDELGNEVDTLCTNYSTLNQTVNGLSTTVGQHTTTINNKADKTEVTEVNDSVAKLKSDLDGFESTVIETYTTKSEFEEQVRTTNSSIQQNKAEIELRVTETQLSEVSDAVDGVAKNLADNYYTASKTDSQIALSASGITQTVSATYATKTALSEVKQTADSVSISLGTTNANVATAQETANTAKNDAATAQSTANTARTEAADAAKTATNFLEFTANDGLVVGNKTGGAWSGYRAQVLSDSFNILNKDKLPLAHYGADEILLGRANEFRTQITNDSVNILDTNSDTVACYGAGEILLGKEGGFRTQVVPQAFNVLDSSGDTALSMFYTSIGSESYSTIKGLRTQLIGDRYAKLGSFLVEPKSGTYQTNDAAIYTSAFGNPEIDLRVSRYWSDSEGNSEGSDVDTSTMGVSPDQITLLNNTRILLEAPFVDIEGNGNVTGELSAGSAGVIGALTAGSATVNGALSANSATVINKITAGSAGVTGALTAGSATVSGVLSAASASISGNLTANGTSTLSAIELHRSSPYIDFHHGSSTADYTQRIITSGSGLNIYGTTNTYVAVMSDRFRSNGNDVHYLGDASQRWKAVYAVNGTIQTSDRNQKTNIEPIDQKYIELFDKLQPVTFEFNDTESDRTHIGFISQDVKTSMDEVGLTDLDFAGYCRDIKTETVKVEDPETGETTEVEREVLDENGDPVYLYSLRYSEFIALNTKMIQLNKQKIAEQEREIQSLRGEISALIKMVEKLTTQY